jgi:hypothetical protein
VSPLDPVTTYGRARRLASRYCYGVQQHIDRIGSFEPGTKWSSLQNKNDWEIVIIFLTRLRRCVALLTKVVDFRDAAKKCLTEFDVCLPSLKNLRDFEEHFDDYSAGKGKEAAFTWGHLESYTFGSENFSNGVGEVSCSAAEQAARLVWGTIADLELTAKTLGYLSWDDRYGVNGKFRRAT